MGTIIKSIIERLAKYQETLKYGLSGMDMSIYTHDVGILIANLNEIYNLLGLQGDDRCFDGIKSVVFLNKNALKLIRQDTEKLVNVAFEHGWSHDGEYLWEFFDRIIHELKQTKQMDSAEVILSILGKAKLIGGSIQVTNDGVTIHLKTAKEEDNGQPT